jgi:hypothetical protein
MTSQLRFQLGDHNQVALAGADVAGTSGARVRLACLIGLDWLYDQRAQR